MKWQGHATRQIHATRSESIFLQRVKYMLKEVTPYKYLHALVKYSVDNVLTLCQEPKGLCSFYFCLRWMTITSLR